MSPQHTTQPPTLHKRTSSKEPNEEPPGLLIGRTESLSPGHFIKLLFLRSLAQVWQQFA